MTIPPLPTKSVQNKMLIFYKECVVLKNIKHAHTHTHKTVILMKYILFM